MQSRPLLAAAATATALALVATSRPAHALVDLGAEVGVVTRSADAPDALKAGAGFGAHLELSLLPLVQVGAYYLHDQHALSDATSTAPDVTFDTAGARARLVLPIPGSSLHPYGWVGVGYGRASYPGELGGVASGSASSTTSIDPRLGHFIETPVGLGLAYDTLAVLRLTAEAAYRHASSFGGSAYADEPTLTAPKSAISVLLGLSLSL